MARQRLVPGRTSAGPLPTTPASGTLGNARRAAQATASTALPGKPAALPFGAELEGLFGEDFSDVEVRVGLGRSLTDAGMAGAASGERVAFADTSPSKALVAHELAHVVQHRGVSGTHGISKPGDTAEREAVRAGELAARGKPVSVEASAGGVHGGWLSGALSKLTSGLSSAWDATKRAVGTAWQWLTGSRASDTPQEQQTPAPTQTEAPAAERAPAPTRAPTTTTEVAPPVEETQEPEASPQALALQAASDAAVAAAPESMRDHAAKAIPSILEQCVQQGLRHTDQVAYILATTEHESHFGRPRFQRSEPLVEDRNSIRQEGDGQWRGTVHVTGREITAPSLDAAETAYWDDAYGGRLGNAKGTRDARDFRGRGYVQLTGRSNYERMSSLLNAEGFSYTHEGTTWGGAGNPPIDLAQHPTHANTVPELAARILVFGMASGSFTGRDLDRYIHDGGTDFVEARRIVNSDVSRNGATIAGYARRYATALSAHWPGVFEPERVS